MGELATLWRMPRAPGAPQRTPSDWLLLCAGLLLCLRAWANASAQSWPVANFLLCIAIPLALFCRREFPGPAVVLTFGTIAALELSGMILGRAWGGLEAFVVTVVLLYALTRWGSGRELLAGGIAAALAWFFGIRPDRAPAAEALGGALLLLFPAALGALFRGRDLAQRRAF